MSFCYGLYQSFSGSQLLKKKDSAARWTSGMRSDMRFLVARYALCFWRLFTSRNELIHPEHEKIVGCWMLDVGCWMLDRCAVGSWTQKGCTKGQGTMYKGTMYNVQRDKVQSTKVRAKP